MRPEAESARSEESRPTAHSTYHEQSRAHLQLFRSLAEAGLDRGAILDRVTRALAEHFGDSCVVQLLADGAAPLAYPARHPDPDAGATMLAPLRARGRTLGTLSVARRSPGRPYSEDDEAFLLQVAESAALAVANAELYQAAERARAEAELERRAAEHAAERVARLQALTAALSGLDDRAEVARLILGQGAAVLHSDTAILYVIGEEQRTLELVGMMGASDELAARVRTLPLDRESFNTIAVRTGEAIWIESREEQHRILSSPVTASAGLTALTTIPLRAEGRVFGVVGFGFFGPHRFPPEERAFALTLAEQCAQALERARLREEERRARQRAARLQAITAALSEASTAAEVARAAVTQGMEALGARSGVLAQLVEGEPTLEVLDTRGHSDALRATWQRIPLARNLPLTHATRAGRLVVHESRSSFLAAYPELGGMFHPQDHALAAAPLQVEGHAIGALGFTFPEERRFDEADRGFLLALSRQCAQALDRARLYEAELRARLEAEQARLTIEQAARLAALEAARARFAAELSKSLAEVGFDRQAVLDMIARKVSAMVGDACLIRLVSGDGSSLPVCSLHHPDPDARELLRALTSGSRRAGEALTTMALSRPEPTRIAVITPEQAYNLTGPDLHAWVDRRGLSSLLVVPLRARGRLLGTISLYRDRGGRPYAEVDEAFVLQLADRAALAIANADLFELAERARAEAEAARRVAERTADRLARVQQVTEALSEAMTPQQVAEALVEHGLAATLAPRLSVYSLSEDGTHIELLASGGFPETVVDFYRRVPVASDAPAAAVVRRGAAEFFETAEEYRRAHPEAAMLTQSRAVAGVPLILSEGRVVGSFTLSFDAPRRFDEDDRLFLLTLARQCAQALDRARLYEAERRARIEAEQANRAKDEFLGIVSHELRTPLNAILGWAHLLKSGSTPPAALSKGLDVITRNATAQTKIVEDILDVSRIISGKLRLELRPTDPEAVARAALEVVRPAAEFKKIELELRVEGAIPQIASDPDRLQQVIWNLLSNAVKFTPRGGRVELLITRVDGEVRIEVSDTGAGIEPSFLPYIFERFRQADSSTSRRHGGLGLGLAIVRHLVELHGGAVRVESEGLERGTRIIVTLPVPPAEEDSSSGPGSAAARLDTPQLSLRGLRVLVVDDEPDARELMREILSAYGAVVHAASSGDEAVSALEALRPDVLVSDIGMPGEDGFELLRRVRALPSPYARIPAIALTAYAGEVNVRKSELSGFQGHLSKPVDPTVLVSTIASVGRPPGAA